MVMTGKDRGKIGKVLQVFPAYGKVIVEGANIRIKNLKPRSANEKGQKIEYPAPLDVSNVSLLDKAGKPTRVAYKVSKDDKGTVTKVRIAKTDGEVID